MRSRIESEVDLKEYTEIKVVLGKQTTWFDRNICFNCSLYLHINMGKHTALHQDTLTLTINGI